MQPRLLPLVLCAFASQAQLVVLAAAMVAVAGNLGVPVGVVGQARSVTAAVALGLSVLLGRPALRCRFTTASLAAAGAVTGATGSFAVALSPGLAGFLAAHVLVGAGLAALLSAAFTGAGAFPPGQRLRVLGWVAAGNAIAWVVVAPAAGALAGAVSWRAAQLVPAAAAGAALIASRWLAPVREAGGLAPANLTEGSAGNTGAGVLRHRPARRWLLGESIAYAAWTALLTFGGAYLADRFDMAESAAGLVLAAGAISYAFSSTQLGLLGHRFSHRNLVMVSTALLAVLVPWFLAGTGPLPVVVALYCVAGLSAGVRTPSSAALGLTQLEGRTTAMMTSRTGATQLGYLLGAAVGGPVISVFGYGALGGLLATWLLISLGVLNRLAAVERGAAADPRASAAAGPAVSAEVGSMACTAADSTAGPGAYPTAEPAPGSAPCDGRSGSCPAVASGEAELAVDIGQVPLDRSFADEQALADPGVRQPLRHQQENLRLAQRE